MNLQQSGFPNIPGCLAGMGELAENLWWSWNPAARMLFKMLDRPAWKESRDNPDKMLKELPPEILEAAASDRFRRQGPSSRRSRQKDSATRV